MEEIAVGDVIEVDVAVAGAFAGDGDLFALGDEDRRGGGVVPIIVFIGEDGAGDAGGGVGEAEFGFGLQTVETVENDLVAGGVESDPEDVRPFGGRFGEGAFSAGRDLDELKAEGGECAAGFGVVVVGLELCFEISDGGGMGAHQ